MNQFADIHEPLLINTVGHAAGVIIYGIFLFLFLRDAGNSRLRRSWLPVTAALLALFWNLGSLIELAARASGVRDVELLATFSFSALSFLPAVLLHISLDGRFRVIWSAGYLLSASATAMHLVEFILLNAGLHESALLAITVGFGVLTVASLFAVSLWPEPRSTRVRSRIFGTMCLLLFSTSFVHFGTAHEGLRWSSEVFFHHAGIPLALFVLLQDYRFLLLDAYLRFLVNALMAAALTYAAIDLNGRFHLLALSQSNPFGYGILIVIVCLALILFAYARNSAQRWLTRAVFRRANLDTGLQVVRASAAAARDEAQFLREAGLGLADFIGAERWELREIKATENASQPEPVLPQLISDRLRTQLYPPAEWADAFVPMRFSTGEVQYLLLGRRKGGRRYLSEDFQMLGRLAAAVIEQVERIRRTQMQQLVSQAELRALQAQINPHFLFNSLNALYGAIPRQSEGARRTVLNLADIFRYFLRSDKGFISLSEELKIIRAYLEIEELRLGARLENHFDIDERALSVEIPILSVQPLVENAVKHGISPKPGPGRITLTAKFDDNGSVCISVRDSGDGFPASGAKSSFEGARMGLDNVRQRLKLCYGKEVDLEITSAPGDTVVSFRVPASTRGPERGENIRGVASPARG